MLKSRNQLLEKSVVIVLEMQGLATSKVKEKQAMDDGTCVVNDLHLHLPKLFQ